MHPTAQRHDRALRDRVGHTLFVTTVTGRLISWNDEEFPAVVDVALALVDGSTVVLRDKAPVFGVEPDSEVDIRIECRVIDDAQASRDGVRVQLAHGITSLDGQSEFTVAQDRLGN